MSDQVVRCEAMAPSCGRSAGHRPGGLPTANRSAWTQPRKLPTAVNSRAAAGSDCNARGANRRLSHSPYTYRGQKPGLGDFLITSGPAGGLNHYCRTMREERVIVNVGTIAECPTGPTCLASRRPHSVAEQCYRASCLGAQGSGVQSPTARAQSHHRMVIGPHGHCRRADSTARPHLQCRNRQE